MEQVAENKEKLEELKKRALELPLDQRLWLLKRLLDSLGY